MATRTEGVPALVDTSLLEKAMTRIDIVRTSEEPLDILPVRMDISLGDTFEEIYLDDAVIIARMHEEGFNDEQIAHMPIHISSDVESSEKNTYTFGVHKNEGKGKSSLRLYPNSYVATHVNFFKEVLRLARPTQDITLGYIDSKGEASALMSKSLYHEIRHARQHQLDPQMERTGRRYHMKYLAKFGAEVLGVSALFNGAGYVGAETLASHNPTMQIMIQLGALASALVALRFQNKAFNKKTFERYQANPVEIDARQAGEEAPDDAVRVIIKADAMSVSHKA